MSSNSISGAGAELHAVCFLFFSACRVNRHIEKWFFGRENVTEYQRRKALDQQLKEKLDLKPRAGRPHGNGRDSRSVSAEQNLAAAQVDACRRDVAGPAATRRAASSRKDVVTTQLRIREVRDAAVIRLQPNSSGHPASSGSLMYIGASTSWARKSQRAQFYYLMQR